MLTASGEAPLIERAVSRREPVPECRCPCCLGPKSEEIAMALDEDWITDLHFSELSNGVTLLERVLRQEREAVIERCRRELAAMPEDIRETDDSIEIRVSEREHEIATEIEQVAQEIPRLLMKYMIVGTWSLFEG